MGSQIVVPDGVKIGNLDAFALVLPEVLDLFRAASLNLPLEFVENVLDRLSGLHLPVHAPSGVNEHRGVALLAPRSSGCRGENEVADRLLKRWNGRRRPRHQFFGRCRRADEVHLDLWDVADHVLAVALGFRFVVREAFAPEDRLGTHVLAWLLQRDDEVSWVKVFIGVRIDEDVREGRGRVADVSGLGPREQIPK